MSDRGYALGAAWQTQGSSVVSIAGNDVVVEDPTDFDSTGRVDIDGTRYAYTRDADAPDGGVTLTLDPTPTDVDPGDTIAPVLGGQVVRDLVVYVSTDDEGDAAEIIVDYGQRDLWPEGDYDPPIQVVVSDDLTKIEDAPGMTPVRDAGMSNLGAMQDQTTAIGSGGSVALDLAYIPVLNSEHLYWNGVYQPGSEWSRDAWTVTIPDPDGVFEAGDELVMEYLYTDPATAPPSTFGGVGGHLRDGTWGSHPSSFITSQALPAGTAVGDLLIAVAIGNGGSGCTISDSRMTTVAAAANGLVAVGYATDLSDLVCNVGGRPFPLDQFAGIEVISVQGDGSGPLEYDPARIALFDLAAGGPIGSVGGSGHGAVAVIAGAYGSPITIDMATDMPSYTDWGGTTSTSVVGNFGYCSTEPPPSQTNPTNAGETLVVLIGLR